MKLTTNLLILAAAISPSTWTLAQDVPPPPPAAPPVKERPAPVERLQNLKREAEEKARNAEKEGHPDEAERIRRETRETLQKHMQEIQQNKPRPQAGAEAPPRKDPAGPRPDAARPDAPRPDAPRPDAPRPDDLGAKLRHVHAAMEQLQSAGLQDAAAQLRPLAERLERQLAGQGNGQHEVPHVEAELQALRREVNELKEIVRRLQGPPREGGERR